MTPKITRFVAVCAGLLLTGCMAGPPFVEGRPEAASAAAMPAGAPGLSSQADYSFAATLSYVDVGSEDDAGNDVVPADHWIVGLTWYPQGVADDETPYALQPYMQRASSVSFGLGTGNREWATASAEWDSYVVDLSATLVIPETGLRVQVNSHRENVLTGETLGRGYSIASLEAALGWQDEKGFSADLTMVIEERNDIFNRDLGYNIFQPWDFAYRGVRMGARKVFTVGGAQAIDVSGSLEFGTKESLALFANDGDTNTYRLAVGYYPVKFLGIGLSYTAWRPDTSITAFKDSSTDTIGVSLKCTVAGRVDISVDYESLESDQTIAGWAKESDLVGVTVGYRF